MESVRLHLQGSKVWALCRCSACRTVHRYTVRDAVAGPITCKQCGHQMDIKGAVIEAVDRMPGATPPSGGTGGDTHGRKRAPSVKTTRDKDDGSSARAFAP